MTSPYINRFLQPDTIIPAPASPQSWNRYNYVLNNPINASDPSGHKCVGEPDECLNEKGKPINGAGEGERHATTDDIPFLKILGHTPSKCKNVFPRSLCKADAHALSLSLVEGAGPWYADVEVDVVWTNHSLVIFHAGGFDMEEWVLEPPGHSPPASHDNFLTPQFGVSLVGSNVFSEGIQNKPTSSGIIENYSGVTQQEGFTVAALTLNATSSTDLKGDPDFKTWTAGSGVSFGVPDIVAEYHLYTTDTDPKPWWSLDW